MITSTAFMLLLMLSEVQNDYSDNAAVKKFQEYLQIVTSRNYNIDKAVIFWRERAKDLSLPISVFEPSGLPIIVITWKGREPSLPSIMLNSHMDVVPANKDKWKYPPYSGYIAENGDIYGRGAQDAKDVGMQYFEAVLRLRADNMTLLRTVHLTLTVDEEQGGRKGMKSFIKTKNFKDLNIGFALDEGLSSKDNNTLFAFYQDKRPWQMVFTVFGKGGHGSAIYENTAADKAVQFLNKVTEFRKKDMKIVNSHNKLQDYGNVTAVNINIIQGGTAVNSIATNYTIGVDMRLSTDSNAIEMENMINSWMYEAGKKTTVHYIRKEDVSEKTVLDEHNYFWVAMETAVNEMGHDIITLVFPAASDMMYLRNIGIPAVGFTPNINTINRIHEKNEYLNVVTYLHGIDVYYEIIKNIGNVPEFSSSD